MINIHVHVSCLLSMKTFLATFVYGLNKIVQRRPLWESLKRMGSSISCPFNNVLSTEENKGGLQIKNYEISDFVDCVASIDLIDIKYVGCFYTWSSPRVCSKLDRVMVNNDWIGSKFMGFADFIAPGSIFDHALSLVSCFEEIKLKPKSHLNSLICGHLMINSWTWWNGNDDFLGLVHHNIDSRNCS